MDASYGMSKTITRKKLNNNNNSVLENSVHTCMGGSTLGACRRGMSRAGGGVGGGAGGGRSTG